MSKRSFLEFATDSGANITILTADGGRIPAHAEVLRLVCSCMRNAPASDTWDLTQLLIDGNPPSADTVSAVIEIIYGNMHVLDFEMDKSEGRFTIPQLCDMLLFADAVGCSRSFLESMESMIGGCVSVSLSVAVLASAPAAANATVQSAAAPSSATTSGSRTPPSASDDVRVRLDKKYCVLPQSPFSTKLASIYGAYVNGVRASDTVQMPDASKGGVDRLQAALAHELERVLYTAYKLEMRQLLNLLWKFIQENNATGRKGLLNPAEVKDSLLSARVLAAASTESMKGALMHACARRYLGRGVGLDSVFSALEDLHLDGQTLRFNTTLLQGLLGFEHGSSVTVCLNLKTGTFSVGVSGSTLALTNLFGVVVGSEAVI